MDDERESLDLVCRGFIEAVDDVERHMTRQRGGQSVPFFGDFCCINPSTLRCLVWWRDRMVAAMSQGGDT